MQGRIILTTAVLATIACLAGSASAFPIYARKYDTSCQTCHVAIPKLNNFGVAFRNNGYEWPGGEEEMTKDKPVVLAAEANKEAFPRTIWPSWLPRTVPVAILMVNEVTISRKYPNWVSPDGLGTDVELGLGGAIAPGIAARADLTMTINAGAQKADLGIEQAFLEFHPFQKPFLDIRVGKIWPELFSFVPQALGGDYWLYARPTGHPQGQNEWQLAGRQGIEVRSILGKGRLRLVAGTAGSNGNFGGNWDAWARLGLKIGGMRLDGVEAGQEEATTSKDPSKPWRDNSVQLNVFGYYGHSNFLTPPDKMTMAATPFSDEFVHAGGDVNVWLGDANLVGAFVLGHHDHLGVDAMANVLLPKWTYMAMAQLDYVVYPWFIPSVRFEYTDEAQYYAYSIDSPQWHVLGGLNFLIRANVRAYAFAEAGPDSSGNVDFLSGKVGLFTAF